MRAVALADIEAALRVLLLHEPAVQPRIATRLIDQAHCGDKYRKRLGKPHPQFGSGTLMSAASKHARAARPTRYDAPTIAALKTLLDALASRRVI